jgi:hypothetical protein
MLSTLKSYSSVAVLMAGIAMRGFASPAESKLLSLVPAESEIVAGIEDPQNPGSHGRLLLVTHNNKLDFTDWVALTGVDPHRKVDEVIEVSESSSRGRIERTPAAGGREF